MMIHDIEMKGIAAAFFCTGDSIDRAIQATRAELPPR